MPPTRRCLVCQEESVNGSSRMQKEGMGRLLRAERPCSHGVARGMCHLNGQVHGQIGADRQSGLWFLWSGVITSACCHILKS